MGKIKVVCPFSMKACRECGIVRGRHLGICYFPKREKQIENKEDITEQKNREKVKPASASTRFEVPDMSEWNILKNVEDCVERREL
jgi:hypothetical protein